MTASTGSCWTLGNASEAVDVTSEGSRRETLEPPPRACLSKLPSVSKEGLLDDFIGPLRSLLLALSRCVFVSPMCSIR
eukprot:CAMPEP_0181400340 /NCGR_PEP_ID=MMETSP1110-20121109/2066_1 /TAXON_ID=174948 /ORGANISM="Symbiodinium sp., Strain CCMP421" /LENGTH=77 /DNA_ID=CAMNT_0023522439 /DNA_START=153 /DNA_END=386 /DNA_ORIENTATION=-